MFTLLQQNAFPFAGKSYAKKKKNHFSLKINVKFLTYYNALSTKQFFFLTHKRRSGTETRNQSYDLKTVFIKMTDARSRPAMILVEPESMDTNSSNMQRTVTES